MSAKNGYVIRQNEDGDFVLQEYVDDYPDIDDDRQTRGVFDSLDEAARAYATGRFYSEYGLSIDLDPPTPKIKENKLATQQFLKRPFTVNAVQVTEENHQDVAKWCNGVVQYDDVNHDQFFIKVAVKHSLNTRQTQAFVGDWVLESPKGFKVYTDSAFRNNFLPKEEGYGDASHSVFDTPQELRTTSDPVDPKDQIRGKR